MSNEIIVALIGACAIIISALITARSKKAEKGNGDVFIFEEHHNYEQTPVYVLNETEKTIGLLYYAKKLYRLLILIIFYAIFGGLGALAGSFFSADTGSMIGFLIGLMVGYSIARRINI